MRWENCVLRSYSRSSMMSKSLIFVVSFILRILTADTQDTQQLWFAKLPDYRLHGVPKIIVNNEKYRDALFLSLFKEFGFGGSKPNQIAKARRIQKAQSIIPDSVPFPCRIDGMRSAVRPTSVHAIRPGDIDVIAAIGDSYTAGAAALSTNIREYFDENRGVTAAIGGQGTWREFTTVPNLLKVLNPNLYGYSYGDGLSKNKTAGFNVAESMSVSHDIYHAATVLVAKIKNDPRVDFQRDWKMVTIAIGTNNHCSDSCWVKNFTENLEEHRKHLLQTFRYLRDKMPRTIVNFMQTTGAYHLMRHGPPLGECALWLRFACHCLFTLQHSKELPRYLNLIREWQQVDREVPILTDMVTPTVKDAQTGKDTVDLSYWSVDCFHYSQRMNSKMAVAMWNSLFTPDGAKSSDVFKISEKFVCPSERNPYIYTWKNIK